MHVPDGSNNSYLLEVDGNTCFTVGDGGIGANAWTWVDHQGGSPSSKVQMNLNAGNHTLKMIGREPGVKLGRILLVSNLNCVPVNNGDNCATAGTPSDTEGPSVDITAPQNGANVKGTVAVNVTAKDNVGVAKVDFFVNGVLKSSDTSSPYSFNWDTKVTANGKVGLMAKAYDISGNANSDSVQVIVEGGDSQPPSVPGNVTVVGDATNKITVKWAASTDNVGMAGYRILRNKVIVGQVAGTEYVDTSALPGTTYSYQVSAYDQAGNSSAPSAAVEVKTVNIADSQPPAAPTNLTATSVSPSQINLRWTASSDNIGVAAYDVYRSTGKGSAIKVATVSKTSLGDTGLDPKTKYNYYVIARDSALNVSEKSSVASAETRPKPEATNGVLRGKVTFAKNSEGHAHVIIRIKGVKQSYDTDSQGNYEILKLPPGSYKLSYQASGSHAKEINVKIRAGKISVTDVTLIKR
jgi:chitodextrinase